MFADYGNDNGILVIAEGVNTDGKVAFCMGQGIDLCRDSASANPPRGRAGSTTARDLHRPGTGQGPGHFKSGRTTRITSAQTRASSAATEP